MKSEIQIDNNAGVCQIDIEGTIGVPEEWQFDRPEERVATYEKFRDAVRRIAEIDASEVVVNKSGNRGAFCESCLVCIACEYYLDIGPCINKIVGAALQSQDRQSYY